MNPEEIIHSIYRQQPELETLLLTHSRMVRNKALEIIEKRGLTEIDKRFVEEAAMLHDIGIMECDAPGILCHGSQPYICHGVIGRKILENLGLPRHALVCERHTGAGLSKEDIAEQSLPLPHRDMLPITTEEQLICYADKFFSKSGNPTIEKSLDKIRASMARHGEDVLARFDILREKFG